MVQCVEKRPARVGGSGGLKIPSRTPRSSSRNWTSHAGKQGIVGAWIAGEGASPRLSSSRRSGLAEASAFCAPSDPIAREKADRQLEQAVKQIIEHPVFKDWLQETRLARSTFREAGLFLGASLPAHRQRPCLSACPQSSARLATALQALGMTAASTNSSSSEAKCCSSAPDIERCLEFQRNCSPKRFTRDLTLLAPGSV